MIKPPPPYKRQVELAGLPGYRQNLSDTVAEGQQALGRGIGQLGQGIERYSHERERVRAEAENAELERALAELANERHTRLSDPKFGFTTTRKGKHAADDYEKYLKDFDEVAKQLKLGLKGSERQRAMFDKMVEREKLNFRSSVDAHVHREGEAYAEGAHNALLDAEMSNAAGAATRGEIGVAQDAIMAGLSAIEARANVKGWSKEQLAAERRRFETQAHMGVLETMLEQGRTLDARDYLATSRRYMDEETIARSDIEKLINAGVSKDAGRALAERVLAHKDVTDPKTGDIDSARATEMLHAAGVEDTKVLKGALEWVEMVGDQQLAQRRQADAPRIGRLGVKIIKNGRLDEDSADYIRLSDQGKLDVQEILQRHRNARGDNGPTERQRQTDRDRLFKATIKGLDPAGNEGNDWISVDIEAAAKRAGASPLALEEIRAFQKEKQLEHQKDNGVSNTEFARIAEAKIAGAGFKGKKAAAARKHLNAAYATHRDPKGLPPSKEQVDEWFDEWLRTVPEWGRDPTNLELEMRGEKPPVVKKANVPDSELKLILDAYKAKGVANPTTKQIEAWYQQMLAKKKTEAR